MTAGQVGSKENKERKEAKENNTISNMLKFLLKMAFLITIPNKKIKGYIAQTSPSTLFPKSTYLEISKIRVKKNTNLPNIKK